MNANPAAVGVVDLEQGVNDLDFGRTADGVAYGEALLLVRSHGVPLATVMVGLRDGGIAAAELERELSGVPNGAVRAEREVDRGEPPFVSVIVPTAGRPERMAACIGALRAMRYPSFEIVIVDNSPSVPGTREAVAAIAAEDPRVRYVAEPLPGSSVARNRGIREAGADLLAFTDDDVQVDPEWLSWMVEPFLRDRAVGVVTGLVLPARMDTPEQRWFEEYSGFGKGLEPRLYDLDEHRAPENLLYPYWGAAFGSGNSMAFRRGVIEGIGGFDPALGAGSPARAGADVEAFSHAILEGSRLAYEPRALCWHDHRTHSAALKRQTFAYGAGFTAILTKSVLREPRLALEMARQLAGVMRRTGGGGGGSGSPRELGRLRNQFAMSRTQGTLGVQLGGYLAGPALYMRSVLWARRRRLDRVLKGEETGWATRASYC
jgi:O-antigen biosynthesis protein